MADEYHYGVFGRVMVEPLYHVSSLCIGFKSGRNVHRGTVSLYPDVKDAIMAGHDNRCPFCFNQYLFRIRVGTKEHEFLLKKEKLGVLLGMARIHRTNTSITVANMVEYGKMTVRDVRDHTQSLRHLKLVSFVGFRRRDGIPNRDRRLTLLGMAIVLAYEAKCYLPPLSEQAGSSLGSENIHHQI